MRLKVYDAAKNKEEVTVTLRLKLAAGFAGDIIQLVAVDETGEVLDCGAILSISPRGVRLYEGLNLSLGFELEGLDKIKLLVNSKGYKNV